MAQGGQYLSQLHRHLSQLLRHLRVVCSHDAFQICNPLPDIADWYNPSTLYKYLHGIFTEVVNDAGVGDGDHQISDLVIPIWGFQLQSWMISTSEMVSYC